MKTSEEHMTATKAAGYILGVGLGFLRHHCKTVAILLACVGVGIIFVSFFRGSMFIGASMVAVGAVLWVAFSKSRD